MMMDTYTVSFFGHRRIENAFTIEKRLDEIIRPLLTEKEYVTEDIDINLELRIDFPSSPDTVNLCLNGHKLTTSKQGLPLTMTQRAFLWETEKTALDSAKDSLLYRAY